MLIRCISGSLCKATEATNDENIHGWNLRAMSSLKKEKKMCMQNKWLAYFALCRSYDWLL